MQVTEDKLGCVWRDCRREAHQPNARGQRSFQGLTGNDDARPRVDRRCASRPRPSNRCLSPPAGLAPRRATECHPPDAKAQKPLLRISLALTTAEMRIAWPRRGASFRHVSQICALGSGMALAPARSRWAHARGSARGTDEGPRVHRGPPGATALPKNECGKSGKKERPDGTARRTCRHSRFPAWRCPGPRLWLAKPITAILAREVVQPISPRRPHPRALPPLSRARPPSSTEVPAR